MGGGIEGAPVASGVRLTRTSGWLVPIIAGAFLALPSLSHSAPVTYELVSGTLDSVTLVDLNPLSAPVSALVDPVAIDAASVTLDSETNQVLGISILLTGTGELDMQGVNGYETALFTGTSFQSSGTAGILSQGANDYFLPIQGQVDVLQVDLYAIGSPAFPDPDYSGPYQTDASPSGWLDFAEGDLVLTLEGVDIGVFVDPVTQADPVIAKANFSFTARAIAPVPEPSAGVLFLGGFLVAAMAVRRDGRSRRRLN